MRTTLFVTATLLVCLGSDVAQVTAPTIASRSTQVTAFTNVNVIPMDSEITLRRQTVVVQNGLITAVGPSASTPIPVGTNVIDGGGGYLMPGLADMHIHLDHTPGLPEFWEAPLYLSYGITTVLNLRGFPMDLELRKRILNGQLLAPNLYTSGEFVDEPRIRTPDEAEREVTSQFRAGYEVIKYHQIVDDKTRRWISTVGLSIPAYVRLAETVRKLGIPFIGHAPERVPLETILREHQSFAHMGELPHNYYFPLRHLVSYGLWTAASLALFLLGLLEGFVGEAIRILRKRSSRTASWRKLQNSSSIFGIIALLSLTLSIALILLIPVF
jgi:hypothetical protein